MAIEETQSEQDTAVNHEAEAPNSEMPPTVADILNNNSALVDHLVHPNRTDDGEKAFGGDGYANDIDTSAV